MRTKTVRIHSLNANASARKMTMLDRPTRLGHGLAKLIFAACKKVFLHMYFSSCVRCKGLELPFNSRAFMPKTLEKKERGS